MIISRCFMLFQFELFSICGEMIYIYCIICIIIIIRINYEEVPMKIQGKNYKKNYKQKGVEKERFILLQLTLIKWNKEKE